MLPVFRILLPLSLALFANPFSATRAQTLAEGDLQAAQGGNPGLVRIDANHPVAEVGEACTGDKADIAGSDDCDRMQRDPLEDAWKKRRRNLGARRGPVKRGGLARARIACDHRRVTMILSSDRGRFPLLQKR